MWLHREQPCTAPEIGVGSRDLLFGTDGGGEGRNHRLISSPLEKNPSESPIFCKQRKKETH